MLYIVVSYSQFKNIHAKKGVLKYVWEEVQILNYCDSIVINSHLVICRYVLAINIDAKPSFSVFTVTNRKVKL